MVICMDDIRVALVGVGNSASALIQGVKYYQNAKEGELIPGLLHVNFGEYPVKALKFVAAFDVDSRKVGNDLSEAIFSEPNNTRVFCKVPKLGVKVMKGNLLDGLGKFVKDVVKVRQDDEVVDVAEVLREVEADLLVNYLPVGSDQGPNGMSNRLWTLDAPSSTAYPPSSLPFPHGRNGLKWPSFPWLETTS